MKTQDFKKIIKEAVKEAIQEELKDILFAPNAIIYSLSSLFDLNQHSHRAMLRLLCL